MHHRVKNNFQLLISISNIQKSSASDPYLKNILMENNNRVIAMNLIHDEIYFKKNITHVNMHKYLSGIANNLLDMYKQSLNKDVKLGVHIPDLFLEFNKAFNIGILVNELITNCFKHAFNEEGKSALLELHFEFLKSSGYRLTIKDNGPGAKSLMKSDSMGNKIINSQVKMLNGRLISNNTDGQTFCIEFM